MNASNLDYSKGVEKVDLFSQDVGLASLQMSDMKPLNLMV